jgi:hypothetical protein
MCKKYRHSFCEVLPWLAAMALSTPVAGAREPGLLWAVEGQQNTVYLLGSVHLLRDADQLGLPGAAEAAYADAERLVMEIDLDDPAVASPVAMISEMQRSALLPAGSTLREVLGSDHAAIATQAAHAGLDLAMLDGFAPWFVATLLLQAELAGRGFRPELGVEQRIAERALRDGKPIEGLETPAEQFAVLARLPLPLQKRFLQMTLEETESIDSDLERMLEAWRTGNAEALAELLSDGYEEFPELYGPLTEQRNRAWVEEIGALLDDADDYLVVVGALHLVGRDSVVDLLRRRGYEVTRQ